MILLIEYAYKYPAQICFYELIKMRLLTTSIFFVALAAGFCVAEEPKSYAGFKVYRLNAENIEQLNFIQAISKEIKVDFWTKPRLISRNIDVMVAPENQLSFTSALSKYGIPTTVLIENVQETVDRENVELAKAKKYTPNEKISFTQYYRYDDIVAYVQQLAQNYSNLVNTSFIGTTYEGRQIISLTISSGGNGTRKAMLVEGGIHAREWIAPSTVLYLINQLVENYEANKDLVDSVDWFIVPVTNPDGYEYTYTDDRFWRKNRFNTTRRCVGIDANRNFDFYWGGEGGSTDPCDETYLGASGFSEKESSALRDFAAPNADRIKVYLAMHSYGPYFLYPWGYQWDLPEDWEDLDNLAQRASEAIRAVYGTQYEIGSSSQLLYPAAGCSDDYMKGAQGIPFSYTIELPGGGSQGFNPPPSAILPTALETWEAFKLIGQFASSL